MPQGRRLKAYFPSAPTPILLFVLLGNLMGLDRLGNSQLSHSSVFDFRTGLVKDSGGWILVLFLRPVLYVIFGKKILFVQEEN